MAPRKIPVVKESDQILRGEIATAQNDITQYYLGKILLNPDKVLASESGGKGIEIYENLLTDHRIFSEMQKRELAVIGKEWEVLPASDSPQDGDIADFVREVFQNINYDSARQALLSGIVTGFKPAEIMWDYSEGDYWVKEIRGRSPRRFVFDLEGKLRLLTWSSMIEGEELPDKKFIVFRNPSKNFSPYGDGLGRVLYWCSWFRKNGTKFWAIFLERFGQPTPWGKYPSGTDKTKQDLLFEALRSIQTDGVVMTPDSMAVELLEAAKTSSVDSYEKWENYWDTAISLVILGQTATTEGTPGKLGNDTERADVRQEIVKADADLLCECQNNTLVRWLVDYNFPGVKVYPKVWIRTDPEEDLKPLADRDQILVKNIGLPVGKKYFYETYGIPEPQEGEELVTVPQTPSPFASPANPPANSQDAKNPPAFAESPKLDAGQKRIEEMIARASKSGGMSEFRESIQKVVDEAQSLEDLKTKITEKFKGVDVSTLREIMARALVAASINGRISVNG